MDWLIIFCAKYLVYIVALLAVLALIVVPKSSKWRLILTVIVSGIIAYALAKIASSLYYDPRPFVTEHIKPLIDHAADNGFPSDHALFTGVLTAVIFFFSRKIAWVMAAGTILVGIARVLAHVHSPIQIIAAWIIGIIGALIGYFLVRFFFNLRKKQKSPPATDYQE